MYGYVYVVIPSNPETPLKLARDLQTTIRAHLFGDRACVYRNFDFSWCFDTISVDLKAPYFFYPDFRKMKTKEVMARALLGDRPEKEISLSMLKEDALLSMDELIAADFRAMLGHRTKALWFADGRSMGIITESFDEKLKRDPAIPKTRMSGDMSMDALDMVDFVQANELQREYLVRRTEFIRKVIAGYSGCIAVRCKLFSYESG